MRTWEIGRKTLWLDETFSVWLARHPLAEMLAWIARLDQHPPLYYMLLHFWIRLVGDGPVAVRLLSALLSTLAIPAVYCLGRRLLGPAAGVLAALILALSPFHVRFAQETRMYALLTLNVSLALLALTHLRRGPQSGVAPGIARAWIGYVVFTAATMLTHHTALLFPLAVNLFALGSVLWRRLRIPHAPSLTSWLLAQLAVLVLWSPWLTAFIGQAAGVKREFWIPAPTFAAVIAALKTFLSDMLPPLAGRSDLIWAGYLVLGGLGIAALRKRGPVLALLVMLFLAPIGGELLVSLRRPVFYDRTLIWATIPLYLVLAAGIAHLRRWPFVVAALGLVVTANAASLHEYYVNFQKEEWDRAAGYVAARSTDDDLLLFNATWVQIPFDYYFRAYGRTLVERGAPTDLFARGVLEPKMAEGDLPRLRALLAGQRRVWLIYSHNWYTDPQGLIPAALAQEFALREMRRFVGLEVRLYERAAH